MDNKNTQHSTHYIHRISYTAQERMVGVFVLSAIAVLVFLLFSAIKNQNIFEDYFTIYGKLKSAEGLSSETIVQVSGIEVGKVSAIDITDDNQIMLTMHVFNRFHGLLRTDSKVKVSSLNATIIGKSIIEISAGSHDKEMLKENAILDIQESISVDDVIAEATMMLNAVKKVVHDVSNLVVAVDVDKISSTIDSFNKMAINVDLLMQRVKSGQGSLGALVYDDVMQKNISQSVVNIRQTTEDLKAMVSVLKNDASEVPVVLDNIDSIIGEAEKTIQATQKIWPISSAMPNKGSNINTVDPLPAND